MNKSFIISLLIIVLTCPGCKAQKSFTGTVQNYTEQEADIVSFGGNPIKVGKIKESGTFTIPLNTDFIEKTQKAMEAFNKESSSGRFRMNTLEKAFSCYGEGAIDVTNGDQVASTLASFGAYEIADLEKKKIIGYFMATSSQEFAESFVSMGQKDAAKGYYLNWYYVNKPAKIQGTCSNKTFALNQKDSYEEVKDYQYNFKKGWNLVQISADKIYTDSDGKKYFAAWTYKTIPEIPKEVKYLALPK